MRERARSVSLHSTVSRVKGRIDADRCGSNGERSLGLLVSVEWKHELAAESLIKAES